jgi:hypothetical protein
MKMLTRMLILKRFQSLLRKLQPHMVEKISQNLKSLILMKMAMRFLLLMLEKKQINPPKGMTTMI